MLVALLLYSCGVPEAEIVADYALSESWGTSVEGKWHVRQALPERVRDRVEQRVLDAWCEAPAEVLTGVFDALRREHGTPGSACRCSRASYSTLASSTRTRQLDVDHRVAPSSHIQDNTHPPQQQPRNDNQECMKLIRKISFEASSRNTETKTIPTTYEAAQKTSQSKLKKL